MASILAIPLIFPKVLGFCGVTKKIWLKFYIFSIFFIIVSTITHTLSADKSSYHREYSIHDEIC